MTRFLLLLLFGGMVFGSINAQANSDLELAAIHVKKLEYQPVIWHPQAEFRPSWNPITTVLRAAMFAYQKEITYQIHGNCTYHPSCSEFSRQSMHRFGLFKGMLMSIDRVSRCNNFEAMKASPLERNSSGLILDPVEQYELKK